MDYCDFGFEIEMPVWLFALLILFFIGMLVLWFIATIKSIKAYRERTNKNKPKKDEMQELLNTINDRIIDLEESIKNYKGKDLGTKEMLEERKRDFMYFKGMVVGSIYERNKRKEEEK